MANEFTAEIQGKSSLYVERLHRLQNQMDSAKLADVIRKVIDVKNRGGRIFACGNGGSAATATHFVCDLNKLLSIDASTLHDNVSTLMAMSNDISYEDALVEIAKIKMDLNDLLFVFTGSGNSENILRLISYSKQKHDIILFTGFDGGEAAHTIGHHMHIHVKEDHMGRVEDCHMLFCHLICYLVKDLAG